MNYRHRSLVFFSLTLVLGHLTACGTNFVDDTAGNAPASSPAPLASSAKGVALPRAQPIPATNQEALKQKTDAAPQERNLPQNSNGEKYDSIQDNQFQRASLSPLSTFSIDVDTASYSNLRRFINSGELPPVDAVRLEEMINYFTYDYPQPTGSRPFSLTTEVADAPWNPNHRLVQIGLQGKRLSTENLPPNNLVFLLDVSGSMAEPNKLPLLKQAMRLLVNELRANDKVAIVVYADNARVVLPSTPGSQKQKIIDALDKLQAGGSTAGGEGIQMAYKVARENFFKSGNNRVIMATDGDFNVGVSSDAELVKLIQKERNSGIFLSVLGVGMGNLQDTKMEKLADNGNGNYAYIDNLLEAKKVLVKEFGATLFTIANDVKIQVEFNPALVQAYKLIGYEKRHLQNQDFNDDKKDAGELGPGRSVTALYEIIPVGVKTDVPLANIDPLKYQNNPVAQTSTNSNELMQVKVRYKAPQQTSSQSLSFPIIDRGVKLGSVSDNLKFSAAVAAFGMVLRNSPYKGTANFDEVLQLARQSQGPDLDGYRAEFVRLVEKSKTLRKT